MTRAVYARPFPASTPCSATCAGSGASTSGEAPSRPSWRVRGAFGHILTFRGRASRSAFWWFVLLQIIAYLVIGFITNRSSVAGTILDIVVGIPLWLAGLSLTVRRLHDANHTGWWWWIGLVPIVGWIVLLVFYLLPGTPGPNRYNFAR